MECSCRFFVSSVGSTETESVVMSKRLERRRRRLRLVRRRKYFWAWLATCVGVRVLTKFLEIPLQSPFPTFCNPKRNSLCSSSVHGTPRLRSRTQPEWWGTASSAEAYPSSAATLEESLLFPPLLLLLSLELGCSYWERLFKLTLFLIGSTFTLTPNSMISPPPADMAAGDDSPVQVTEFWTLFPECEPKLNILLLAECRRKMEKTLHTEARYVYIGGKVREACGEWR